MKMKMWIRLLALAAGMVIVLCACSANPVKVPKLDPKNPVSIEIWHYYNGPQKTAFDELVTEFNETVGMKQGIIVQAFSQGNVNELINKVIDAANEKVGAGDVPNIFAAYADTAFAVDQLGLVASLDQYLTKAELEEYRTEFLEEGRFDKEGNLKIFPTAKSLELLMLNRTDWDKFSAATGVELSALGTIEGVTATAQKYYEWTDSLTKTPNDGKALFGRDAMANYFIIGCRQLGVEIFGGAQKDGAINADKTVMRKLWDNYYVPFVKGYFGAFGRFRSDDTRTGDVISFVGSSTGATYFPDDVSVNDVDSYPIDCTILPAPCFEGGENYAVQQGAGMVVSKSTEQEEYASTVFLKWFTEAQRNIEFAVGSGYLPVITGGSFAHRASMSNLLGDGFTEEAAKQVSLEEHVCEETPPAFLWHTVSDDVVPVENSLLYASALRAAGVPFELHLYEQGCHGLSLCDSTTGIEAPGCAGWFDLAVQFVRRLP